MTTKSNKRQQKAATQTFEQHYYATRQFKHGERVYEPGDIFVPNGTRRDRQIMEHNCRLRHIVVEASE